MSPNIGWVFKIDDIVYIKNTNIKMTKKEEERECILLIQVPNSQHTRIEVDDGYSNPRLSSWNKSQLIHNPTNKNKHKSHITI